MEPDFWHRRWQKQEIGFHLETVNPLLQRFWPRLASAAGARVFVPLCGKSRDLAWLLAQGHQVIGNELSEIAVQELYAEAGLTPGIAEAGRLNRYSQAGLTVFQGDFFALTPELLGPVERVYDRAALIALPPAMRERYVGHLRTLLSPGTELLLVTLDYAQSQMDGPPFAVPEDEVRRLYEGAEVTCWSREDALAGNPSLVQRGLSRLEQCVYRIVL